MSTYDPDAPSATSAASQDGRDLQEAAARESDATGDGVGTVLHLADREHWQAALQQGTYDRSTREASFEDVGFMHASTPAQLPGVGAAFYADVAPEDLVLLVIDLARLAQHGVEVRWEDVEGAEAPFPHLYAPLPVEAVVQTLAVPETDGVADWAGLVAAVRG